MSSSFITSFPWYCKINLRRLLLVDNFLAHKKCIFLNMSAKPVLRIRNFVKMQGNLCKISCSLPTFLEILAFHNFFPNFSDNYILRTSIFWQKPKSVYYADFYEFKTTTCLGNIWQVISSYNICYWIKIQQAKKPFAIQKPKTFEFFPKSFAPFNQIIFDQSSPCVLLIDKPSENCKNSKTFERKTLST